MILPPQLSAELRIIIMDFETNSHKMIRSQIPARGRSQRKTNWNKSLWIKTVLKSTNKRCRRNIRTQLLSRFCVWRLECLSTDGPNSVTGNYIEEYRDSSLKRESDHAGDQQYGIGSVPKIMPVCEHTSMSVLALSYPLLRPSHHDFLNLDPFRHELIRPLWHHFELYILILLRPSTGGRGCHKLWGRSEGTPSTHFLLAPPAATTPYEIPRDDALQRSALVYWLSRFFCARISAKGCYDVRRFFLVPTHFGLGYDTIWYCRMITQTYCCLLLIKGK